MELALPSFNKIFGDLMAEDALMVMGKGLGVRILLCRFIKEFAASKNLVFVLNAIQDSEIISDMLLVDGLPKQYIPQVLAAEIGAAERKRAYERGGVIISSSQTLLIDLLANRADARLISGILVHEAHRISENSKEAFAIRHFKQKNPRGFIKAFSDDAETLTSGFNRLEKTMRAVYVHKLHLWPRFHQLFHDDLGKSKVDAVEVNQAMTPHMLAIQRALVECMDACLNELKRTARIDVDEATVENGLFDSFDDVVRRQLAGQEHALRPRARAALNDMRMLRKLVQYLLRYDCVTYYMFLETQRYSAMNEGRMPDWMGSDAGERVFKAARERMYTIDELGSVGAGAAAPHAKGIKASKVAGALSSSSSTISTGDAPLTKMGAAALPGSDPLMIEELVGGAGGAAFMADSALGYTPRRRIAMRISLEQNPKWMLLHHVLQEIKELWEHIGTQAKKIAAAAKGKSVGAPSCTDMGEPGCVVLIAARDERTCNQLRNILRYGADSIIQDSFARFLIKNALRSRHQRAALLNSYSVVASKALHSHSQPQPAASAASNAGPSATVSSSAVSSSPMWYDRLGNISRDERELVLAADLPSVDHSSLWQQVAQRAAVASVPAPSAASPVPVPGPASAVAAGSNSSTTSSTTVVPPRVFVAAEQRLLWKQTARMMYSEQADARRRHEELIAMYHDSMRAAERAAASAAVGAGSDATDHAVRAMDEEDDLVDEVQAQAQGAVATGGGIDDDIEVIDDEAMAAMVDMDGADDRGAAGGGTKKTATGGKVHLGGTAGSTTSSSTANAAQQSASTAKSSSGAGTGASGAKPMTALDSDLLDMMVESMGKTQARQLLAKDRISAASAAATAKGGDNAVKKRKAGAAADDAGDAVPRTEAGPGSASKKKKSDIIDISSSSDDDDDDVQLAGLATEGTADGGSVGGNHRPAMRNASHNRNGDGGAVVVEYMDAAAGTGTGDDAAARESMSVDWLPRMRVIIYPLSRMDSTYPILADTRPNFIVMYDPDPAFTRECEAYHATCAPPNMRVYMMTYETSSEQGRYIAALKRETKAFERLIHEKAHMAPAPMPTTASDAAAMSGTDKSVIVKRGVGCAVDSWGINTNEMGYSARVGGIAGAMATLAGPAGAAALARLVGSAGGVIGDVDTRPVVVIDMRELRSKLPSLLDQSGMRIEPVTLEVGDYILSPDLCVERKSLPDLYGSMNSGRLYNQAEAMSRHYKHPILLIEFEPDKPFVLTDNVDISNEIEIKDIRSKLVLLTLHFPSLRILWSRSPHATVELFTALKKGQLQPDVLKALAAGTEDDPAVAAVAGTAGSAAAGHLTAEARLAAAVDAVTTDSAALYRDNRNLTAIDLLRKLPGVNAGNYKAIIEKVPSLAQLARLREQDLAKIIGNGNAALLYQFIHEKQAAAAL